MVDDRAFVMYNVGISAWDIGGANAENPPRLSSTTASPATGSSIHAAGEADGYLNDIAAIPDPSNPNRILIAVASSLTPIGFTLWRFDRATGQLTQAYQNTPRQKRRRRADQLRRPRLRHFRRQHRRLRARRVGHQQPGRRLPRRRLPGRHQPRQGRRRAPAPFRATSACTERNGKVYVATAYGGLIPVLGGAPDLGARSGFALRRRAPLPGTVRIRHPQPGALHQRRQLLHGGGPGPAPPDLRHGRLPRQRPAAPPSRPPVFDHPLRTQSWAYNYLSYSVSEGTPFLYYGFEGIFPSGPDYERLFDLSNLGGSNQISEITETGGTYTDACNGLGPISYWSRLLRAQRRAATATSRPRKGKFNGRYFYKVNTGTFDVHTRQAVRW